MKKALTLVQTCFLLVAFAAPALALDFGARASYWLPGMDSELRVDSGGVVGTNFDLKNDLGVDSDFFPAGEIWLGSGRHYFALGYFKAVYDGDKVLSGSPVYNGVTYPNLSAHFNMDFKSLDLTYGYRLVNLDAFLAGVSVTALVDAKLIDIETRLTSTGQDQSRSETSLIPAVGVKVNAQLLAKILEAQAVLAIQPLGDKTVTDLILDISYTPFPLVGLHAGWRSFILKINDGFRFSHRLNGPFVALSIGF